MRLINMVAITLFYCGGVMVQSSAQTKAANTQLLQMAAVESYCLEITYNKTSHLIFPAPIRYADLGSEYLIAGKAEDLTNVLRVKAAVKNFAEETNFSVVTEDGRYYSFNVRYNAHPDTLTYDFLKISKAARSGNANEVMLEEMGENSPAMSELISKFIYDDNKRLITYIGAKSFGVRTLLKSIYSHNDKLFFNLELKNKSNVPFKIEYVIFKVVDRRQAKRTVVQERQIVPLRIYEPLKTVEGNATYHSVFLLEQLTIADDKLLQIEVFEKGGSRHQVLQLTNGDLVRAKLFDETNLQTK